MLFNSFSFLVFFPAVVLVYFVIPRKARYIWLLLASYYFYMSWNPRYAVLIAASTVITFFSGIAICGVAAGRPALKKWIVAGSLTANLGILFFFKYFDFMLGIANRALAGFGIQIPDKPFDILLPVGISFYTFQALSYTMDVYRGKIAAEKNILRYALYVSFFPQLVAGPIERSTSLLPQLRRADSIRLWDADRIRDGLFMMLWGYFMKLVIADRMALLVDLIFDRYQAYSGSALLVAAVFFAFQIYCDFGSYSLIAVGSAKVMGFTLMENFNAPYFAASIKEFWRRWHISLSTWFRDYLYIPLGGSRRGRLRTYCNLLLTFLASGLWHGAGMHYVFWGGLHGLYQIIGAVLEPIRNRMAAFLKLDRERGILRFLRCLGTFLLVDIAWIFFRASSLSAGLQICGKIVGDFSLRFFASPAFFTLGLDRLEMVILAVALVLLLLADLVRYYSGMQLYEWMGRRPYPFRWGVYLALFAFIYVFGIYGPTYEASQFIYFQF